MGTFAWVKRHYVWVLRLGGALLVGIGLLLVTGVWNDVTLGLRSWVSGFTPAL
jgi:cytochrome c-type biogenesis protein